MQMTRAQVSLEVEHLHVIYIIIEMDNLPAWTTLMSWQYRFSARA